MVIAVVFCPKPAVGTKCIRCFVSFFARNSVNSNRARSSRQRRRLATLTSTPRFGTKPLLSRRSLSFQTSFCVSCMRRLTAPFPKDGSQPSHGGCHSLAGRLPQNRSFASPRSRCLYEQVEPRRQENALSS